MRGHIAFIGFAIALFLGTLTLAAAFTSSPYLKPFALAQTVYTCAFCYYALRSRRG